MRASLLPYRSPESSVLGERSRDPARTPLSSEMNCAISLLAAEHLMHPATGAGADLWKAAR